MAKLKKADVRKETEGAWVDFQGIKVLIARMGNPKHQAEVRRLIKKHSLAQGVSMGELDLEVMEGITQEAFSRYIILDWAEMESSDEIGVMVEYSPEKALEIIRNPEYHEFYSFCTAQSNNRSNFMAQSEAADAKNS